ncbi:hypothetical protein C8Q78DRAFT_1105555 [Trametes maxima]|nr:hypothetical protein C8Q78DRAFT_1105555 [Trametes maxima]
MLSDWSSLTELSESEDEYVPAKARGQPKKKPGPKPREYKASSVTNYLRPYRTTTYTAKSLYDQIVENTIQLDPEYQRDVVWTESKQVGLIDSLLRNFYIPPVIFAVKTHDDGSETRTCIDGKQRLTSIQLATNKKYYYRPFDDEKRAVLPKPLHLAFANKQIVCVEYEDLTDDQEREIFQRVQLGVALTAAVLDLYATERLQAIPGPWPALIREVQSLVLGDEGFGEDLDWGHDRGRDFSCLASIIHLIDSHPSTTFPGAPRLEKWLTSTHAVPAKTRDDVFETFRVFVALVRDKKTNMPFSKPARVSPIEFTMMGVLISRFRKQLSPMQLSNAIWKMRADVRQHHKDIRQNTKVAKTMFKFITKGMVDLDLIGDGKGDIPASIAIKSNDAGHATANAKSTLLASASARDKRRRRQTLESSESETEEVLPRKRPSLSNTPSSSRAVTVTKSKAAQTKKVTTTNTKPESSKATSKATSKTTTSSRASRTTVASKPASQHRSPATASTNMIAAPKTSSSRITARTTRTAASAAADSLALSQNAAISAMESIPNAMVAVGPTSVKKERSTVSEERMDEDPPIPVKTGTTAPTPAKDSEASIVSQESDTIFKASGRPCQRTE